METAKKPLLVRLSLARHSMLSSILQQSKPLASLWPVMLLTDFLQVLFLICGPHAQSKWDWPLWRYLITIGKVISWTDLDNANLTGLTFAAAAGTGGLLATLAILWFHIPINDERFSQHGWLGVAVKGLVGYSILLRLGLLTYIFQAAVSSLFCPTCQTSRSAWTPIAVLACFLVLLTQYWLLHPATLELNPLAGGGISQYYSNLPAWRTSSRIIISFLYFIFIGVEFFLIQTSFQPWVYAFLCFLLAILILGCDLTIPQTGSFTGSAAHTGKNLFLAVLSFASLVQVIYPTRERVTNLSLVYVFLSIISSSVVVYFLEKQRASWYSAPSNLKSATTIYPLVSMVYSLVVLVERMDSVEDIWGATLHKNLRKIATLPDNASLLSEASRTSLAQLLTKRSTLSDTAFKTADFKQKLYVVLLDLGLAFKRRHPENPYLRLLLAYLMCLRLGLKWRGIFELESVLKDRTDSVVTVAALLLLRTVEAEVLEEDIVSSQNNGMDTSALLTHQREFVNFRDLLGKLASTMRRFWEELTHKKSSGNLLQEVGFEIATLTDQVSSTFHEIISKSSKLNVQLLQLYSEFLFLVLSEMEEAKRISVKAQNMLVSMSASRNYGNGLLMLKNFDTFSPCIIVTSGSEIDTGKIRAVNQETMDLLERNREELVGEQIEVVMPGAFAKHHKTYVCSDKDGC